MSYNVHLDTGRDLTYAAELTSRVIDVTWNAGMAAAYEEVAQPARLVVRLDNADGLFTPGARGSERVANGEFATWSGGNPSSWTVTGESGTDPEVSQVGPGKAHGEGGTGLCNLYSSSASAVSISQVVLAIGTRYVLSLVLATRKAGSVVVKSGTTEVSPHYQVPGRKEVTFVATSTTLKIESVGATDVTIDSVSCKAASLYGEVLRPGTMIRLRNNTDVLYAGLIRRVDPVFSVADGQHRVTVTAECPMLELLDADYMPGLLTNATIDQAFDEIFDKAIIAYPYAAAYWILGAEGASELGRTTKLYKPPATAFDTGSTTLAYIGDNMDAGKGVSAQRVIRELMASEFGGRFFYQPRDGKFTFHSRRRDAQNFTVAATIDSGDVEAVALDYGADLANVVTVDYEPRVVGAAGTVLWTCESTPFHLKRGQPQTFQIRYNDADNPAVSVGAKDVITPVLNLDVVANSAQDGSGINMSHRIGVSLTANGGAATLTVWTNLGGYYITTLKLRGTPIRRLPRATVEASDGDSIRLHNRQVMPTVSVPAVDNAEYAQSGARWLVGRYSTLELRARDMTLRLNNRHPRLATYLALTIGSRVTITDPKSGHTGDYFIVGERHAVTGGGDDEHMLTLVLQPASVERYWILGRTGYSELGRTTRLAF